MTDDAVRGVVRATTLATALVLLLASLTAAYRLGASSPAGVVSGGSARLPAEFAAVAELYEQIQQEAVEVPADEVLLEGALEGMLERLEDPYAAYYDPAAFAAFNSSLDGEFSGVGMVLEETPTGLEVVTVLPGTPAEAAGVRQGERIVSVDGRDVRELPIEVVVDLVKGEEGTSVTLGLASGEGEEQVRELRIERARIELPTLQAELLDDGAGYLRLLTFSEQSAERVRAAVEDLLEQGARGIVLDLRGNPGGLLREAIGVASVFIEEGEIVSVQERDRKARSYGASGSALDEVPLVVLVDRGSASASEIVAGAIQDLDRGPVVGQTTFGKGTVQTVRLLPGAGGVKFTIAEYFTPSGDSIEGVGVVPDRVVAGVDAQLAAARELLHSQVVGAPQ